MGLITLKEVYHAMLRAHQDGDTVLSAEYILYHCPSAYSDEKSEWAITDYAGNVVHEADGAHSILEFITR